MRELLPSAPEVDTTAPAQLPHDLPRLLELTGHLTTLTAMPEFEALLILTATRRR
ncbi:MAG: hypothetical protein ACUVSY_03345 [Roseiflexus sp.]